MNSILTTETGPELGLNTGMPQALAVHRLLAVTTLVF